MLVHDQNRPAVTVVANHFIDGGMANAAGEYVKVYLYLLRMAQDPGAGWDISLLADRLELTERDVLRALRYWEKEGWLTLTLSGEEKVEEICLTRPAGSGEAADPAAAAAPDLRRVKPEEKPAERRAEEPAGTPAPVVRTPARESVVTEIGNVRAETLEHLMKNEDFSQFVFVAETYLGRTLTPRDVQLFAYLYDELKFPEDLLEYLVEYCVGGGHKSCRYMESVALGWHQEGKRTVQQAKEAAGAFSRENKEVMRAFGMVGRVLNPEERAYVEKWTGEYRLPLDVIVEACNTTMRAIQKPSFPYTDKILADWQAAGIRTPEEARKSREARKPVRQAENLKPASGDGGSRFRNYQQRNIDYDALLSQEGLNPYGKE